MKFSTTNESKTMIQISGQLSQSAADKVALNNSIGGILWGVAAVIFALGLAFAAVGWAS